MQFYRDEKDATLWKVVALTANVSQNKNDYGADIEDFKDTASSLSWRPLDWNHDHSLMLPFPENRTELARFEDNAVETIIRIENDLRHYENGKLVNDMIRDGDILHVSIEGTPRGATRTEKGIAPRHWHFTGLALLEKDVTLPGDPLTYIEPLLFNESMGRSLVESLMEKGREQRDMTEQKPETKTEEVNLKPLANLTEEYTGVGGIDVCGQCKFFEDLKNATVEITDVGEQDSSVITRTSGGLGAGVGICRVATQLEGKTKYVRKNDPVCTDGRPRSTPTDADRIKEEKTLDEIETEVMKADYEKRLADKENRILEEIKATNTEREAKIKAQREVADKDITLTEKQREIAKLTGNEARLKEDVSNLRKDVDNLREEISGLKVSIDAKDKDIKHYNDRYNAYQRTYKELKNETIILNERLVSQTSKLHEESEKRASAVQQAINSDTEKARIQEEYARVMEQLANRTREISDSSQIRSDQAKQQLKDTQEITKLREKNSELTDEIRELKQKLSKRPSKIKVKG